MADIKFLKLHNADDNSVVVVPANKIVCAYLLTDSDGTYTEIGLMPFKDDSVAVNESPEKLYNILKSDGFVRCHRKYDNHTVIFNIEYFNLLIKTEDESVIKLENCDDLVVNETPEKIYNAMIEAKNNMLKKESNISKQENSKSSQDAKVEKVES